MQYSPAMSSNEYVPAHHTSRVYEELRKAGSVAYDMWLPETHYLPHIIKDDEHIGGAVYGKYGKNRGVLIATNERIIFLNKKVLLLQQNEISYKAVSEVNRTSFGPIGTVTLRTSAENYSLRTFNQNNAKNFVEYVSAHLQEEDKNVNKA